MIIELDERPTTTTGRTFRVRIGRSVFIGGEHRAEGSEVIASEALAADLDGEILAEINPDGTERPVTRINEGDLPKLLPPAPIAADVPAPLRDFAKAEAKLDAARDWSRRIAKLLSPGAGGLRVVAGDEVSNTLAYRNRLDELSRKASNEVAACAKVWNGEMIGAGMAVIEAVDRANNLAEEVHKLGFAIFAARLAPLGLATCKVYHLFFGSALHAKYGCERIMGLDTYLGYNKGRQFVYTEGDVAKFGAYMRLAAEREEQAKRLIAEGQKELARVEKAMSKEAA